jgi:hypothetical protein
MKLASRLLAYPELDALLKSIATLVQENSGLDPVTGQPNGTRDLLSDLLGVISRRLEGLARPAPGSSSQPSAIVTTLLDPIDLRGGLQVGAPAWAVRLDPNGNPAVNVDPQTGAIYPPFVDQGGVAAVDSAGNPIDASGNKIDIPPFGTQGARDSDNRALAPDGRLLYAYFDSKQTTLGQVLLLTGKLVDRNVPTDLLKAIDACSTRISQTDANGTFVGYADDNPLIDLGWGGLEIFRYRDAPKLLETMAALIKNDPARAERIMVHLVKVIQILNRTQFQGGQSTKQLLNDLIPLVSKVFNSNGSGQDAADQLAVNLLNTFRDQIQQVRGIPAGLAGMMKYSVYPGTDPSNPAGTLVQPGQRSCMQQLLDMMNEANQCDSWPFGNMANFYLDAMAGNKSILGFTISVYTINQLLNIGFLRSLLCSNITPDNINSLQAFAQSGALDSLIPIVKAFSDRGQTDLIKNIFLTLDANYPTAMAPNEAVVVQILESGMVEELFDALNVMTNMTVPSTGEPVTDVTARCIAALVDVNRGVYDRKGVQHMTLLHLLIDPLMAMSDRIDQRGVRSIYDGAIQNTIDIVLATTQVTDPATSATYEGLLYQGLVKVTASALDAAAKGMSVDPATRNNQINGYQSDLVSLMTGRDLPVLVDTLLAIDASSASQQIKTSIVNVFTPNLSQRNDIYGSVCEILAAMLLTKTDPTAMVDLLHFAGKILEPQRGWSKPLILSLMKLVSGQNVILTLVKNALDRGPNGTAKSPAETLLSIMDDIKGQSSTAGSAITAQSIADSAQSLANFIRNKDNGLESIYTQLTGHAR